MFSHKATVTNHLNRVYRMQHMWFGFLRAN